MATTIGGVKRSLAAIAAKQVELSQQIKADNAYWTAPLRSVQRSSAVATASALKFVGRTIGRAGVDPNGNS